ncbi:hypothetical protein SeMB42_g03575 [Synchytrium endobioticum]|uniref:Uncharacterized protein n=1 Tax=Synchytrium endobioticum TaxID=286115 RepID=A0A507CJU7_9FUNG|nr:hypothetical protein SeLEV6574_g07755 [Synchytrium endobioticum]TPX46742.1 hypothetical protein SeMB42_g03575 [Synchytrium endobioticum]
MFSPFQSTPRKAVSQTAKPYGLTAVEIGDIETRAFQSGAYHIVTLLWCVKIRGRPKWKNENALVALTEKMHVVRRIRRINESA